MGGDTFYKGQTAGEYIEKLRQKPDAPEIIYYDSYFSEQQIADLYRACDVFVCSYRGEGFSLPTLEAMACGLPVVVTKGGATDDFVDDEVAWLINAERRSVGSKLGDKQLTGEAFLLEPDLKNLCEILLDIYSNPNNIAYKGLTASYRARTIWTWKRSTMKVLSRLDALYGTSMSMKAKDTLVDNPDGYTYLCKAETSFLNGGYDAALADYYSAYYSPDLTVLHKIHSLNRMASIYILQNKLPLAEDFLNIAEGLSRDNPDTIYLQSALYAKKQEWAESLETLQVLLKNWQTLKFESTIGISLDMLLSTSAEGILNLGDVEGALNVFTEALRLNNYNAEACYGSAMCFLAYGEQEEARKMLEWAIRLKPDFKEALQAMEVINAKNGSLVS
jgi:tetratricopeptide (TPR) repeat protein